MKEQAIMGVRQLLEGLDINLETKGMTDTPKRVATLFEGLFSGCHSTGKEALGDVYPTEHTGLVSANHIPFYSICEHHLMPFYGKVHIVYQPRDGKVFGLGRLKALVDVYAKRPQLQERLTHDIATSLVEDGDVLGAMVMVEATHLCMLMKGEVAQETVAKTMVATGILEHMGTLREEALVLLGGNDHV